MMPSKRVRAFVSLLTLCAAAAVARADEPFESSHPFEHVLQFRGNVLVQPDGNGVLAGQFPTTAEGPAVHYVLLIENGCNPSISAGNCPPPVAAISVRLNDDVVFQSGAPDPVERVPVPLNEVGGALNRLLVAASGTPGAAARVTVLAVRPLPIVVGGRSVLPLATTLGNLADVLIVHNAGPEDIVVRLEVFNADGTSIGLTPPRHLVANATLTTDVASVAQALDPSWVRGPVHVRWAARGFTRVSSVVREFRRAPDASGTLVVVGAYELALDDYGPHPFSPAEAALFGF